MKFSNLQIRQYFKPSQKEAFFDVEGVVTKDVLLFRYDDSATVRKVFYTLFFLNRFSLDFSENLTGNNIVTMLASNGTIGLQSCVRLYSYLKVILHYTICLEVHWSQ